ncbi:Oxoglutarate/iron-dependent dioxygenase [Penicillium atrosanguineum]|nr:Oxoglutarate/iron-dependent dioxygenase [Penicillium atrosanguineum]
MVETFSSVPKVDYSRLQDPSTKDDELLNLREAIFVVGFLYLTDTGLEDLFRRAHEALPALFALPSGVKEECNMMNSPSFLGYTQFGAETTAARTDLREVTAPKLPHKIDTQSKQFDFGTPGMKSWTSQDPFWQRLEGSNQYPAHPGSRSLVEEYITAIDELAQSFLHLVAECLCLPTNTLDEFKGRMSRLKFVKYPQSAPESQGVGPHKDSAGLFTFLSQDDSGGLQVLNKNGEWVDVPPVDGSLVINIQQGFEAITGGACAATTHRVVAPTSRTQYSIPYFLGVRLDLTLDKLKEPAAHIVSCFPTSDNRKKGAIDVPSEFMSPLYACFGEAHLRNRILSHPDVGRRWYPELYSKYSQQALK